MNNLERVVNYLLPYLEQYDGDCATFFEEWIKCDCPHVTFDIIRLSSLECVIRINLAARSPHILRMEINEIYWAGVESWVSLFVAMDDVFDEFDFTFIYPKSHAALSSIRSFAVMETL